ncbi:aminoacyl-tRNA hydrolase [Qiania dongpingensis]|uniref:Peptidyl-tRNA hydrolase n=1 Tax=Qiania dongpingensis TaxID=2763669 RepID=A0A7G9G0J9_9FIRM|nr:aminoacyl-tRNA hydrolase [Qiania dongpingensis]QNM04331.1 aminoacyl-tRNA hydrolase [Qiania dongpingensis]
MFVIAGLGNPGLAYAGTRHNVGFGAIDELADSYRIGVDTKKHKGLIGKGNIGGQKVILLKPQTYMNLSGESIREVLDYYKLTPEELLVIYDDINLDPGQLRIREKGSAGGHNGMKNIISHLGTDVFSRIRVGVGSKPPRMDLADYVLGHFSAEELPEVRESLVHAAEAAAMIAAGDMAAAMNKFNGKKK